jgi:signal transduction histidine kinase
LVANRNLERLPGETQATHERLRTLQGSALLAVGAVHDIRNVLITIAGERGAELCNKSLTAERDRSATEVCAIEVELPVVWRRLRALLSAPVVAEVMVEDASIRVHNDDLVQTVHNLVLNADQACGADLRIKRIGRGSGARDRLCVQDNGPGLPLEVLGRIRTPKVQVTEGQAHGLGLALVQELAIRNGATFGVDTDESGTTVWLEFEQAP